MIGTGCRGKHFGDIPVEYSILPIGFLNFHRIEASDAISLVGANLKSEEFLNLSMDEIIDLHLEYIDFDSFFVKKLKEAFVIEDGSIEFISSICCTNQLFHCTLVRMNQERIGCFFSNSQLNDTFDQNLTVSNKLDSRIYNEQQSFKHLFHTFFHHVPVGIVLVDQFGKIEDVNNYFTNLFGYTVQEIIHRNIDNFIVPDYLLDEGSDLTEKALNREVINYQTIRKTKEGKELYVLIQAAPIILNGCQLGVFLIYQDFTSQQQALDRVKVTGRKLEELHRIVHRMDACKEENQVYQVTVEAAANILKLDSSVIVALEKDKLVPQAVSGNLSILDFPTISSTAGVVGLAFQSGKTIYYGDVREVEIANKIRDDFRAVLTIPISDIGVFQAISTEIDAYSSEDVKLAELLVGHTEEVIRRISLKKQLYYQANYDALTGLINRHYFNQLLDREVNRAQQYNYGITFLMIDVDNFKKINDTLGHLAGDKVLRDVAKLILENVRECDYVVRYGGDEFLVIMTQVDYSQNQENVDRVITRLRDSVKEWCEVQEAFLRSLSISIGAAHWNPEGAMSIKEVLYEADIWMYSDKKEASA